jgi:Domain of unknown function (DUF4440)
MTARDVLAGVLLTCTAPAPAGPSTNPSATEAELRRITQELMDAIAPGKADVWRRYLHEKVIHLDENGVVRNKAELLKELTPLPAGLVGRIAVDRYQVELHGDTAVAAGEMQEYLDYHGQSLRTRFRFLDTWTRTREGWRLIAEHTSAVLKDPPAVRLTRDELCAYTGLYQLTLAITTIVRCTDDGLTSERTGRPATTYLAEVRDVFFIAGQPRTRRIFLRDAAGKVVAFVDRREGEDVRWQRTGDAS